MPAEIVPGEFCSSWFGVYRLPSLDSHTLQLIPGSPLKYIVDLSGGEGPAHCTCPAFAHFKGGPWDRTCKHIEYVHKHACLWNCQWHEGNPPPQLQPESTHGHHIPESKCPNCGEPLVAVRIAV